jgi:hypothetical protein
MRKRISQAIFVAVISFGAPILSLFTPLPFGFALLMSLCLSILWMYSVAQIIRSHGKRGAWILLAAPAALFWCGWWFAMVFATVQIR